MVSQSCRGAANHVLRRKAQADKGRYSSSTDAESGLDRPWLRRVWLNPPFHRYEANSGAPACLVAFGEDDARALKQSGIAISFPPGGRHHEHTSNLLAAPTRAERCRSNKGASAPFKICPPGVRLARSLDRTGTRR